MGRKKKKKKKAGQPYIPAPRPMKDYNQYDTTYDTDQYLDYSAEDDKWWDYVGGKGFQSYYECHQGNSKVLSSSKGEGGSLYIGGWSRGCYHSDEMTVIDLTGDKTPLRHSGNYYSIHINDFGVPQWSLFFWESLAMMVYDELKYGDVLIACQGGHGRSGMVIAILSYLMLNKRYIRVTNRELLQKDPIVWIRSVHCYEAVETVSQEILVYETCLAMGHNQSIEDALTEVRNRPRYVPTAKKDEYRDIVAEWVEEPEESDLYLCPLCLEEYGTMIDALMCCNTSTSLRYCPVCLTKHELPVEAYECCRVAPPIFFDEEEESE